MTTMINTTPPETTPPEEKTIITRHHALVALFYKSATSTKFNPLAASQMEQVIAEIYKQGQESIEALPWYALDVTETVCDALTEDALGDLEIREMTISDEITPMIRNIRRWITLEKRERYGDYA